MSGAVREDVRSGSTVIYVLVKPWAQWPSVKVIPKNYSPRQRCEKADSISERALRDQTNQIRTKEL